MRKNPFATDQALLTEEEIQYIDTTVLETYRDVLVGRKIFPIRNIGQGGGAIVYSYYDEDDPSEAQISMTAKGESEDFPAKTRHDIDVPVIHKEFFFNWRDVAASRRVGPGLIQDAVRTATRMVAEAEDTLLISGEHTGWAALGLEGLFTATGRTNNASAGNWPANAVADINVGRAALQAAGFTSLEPVLIGPPALVKCLDGLIANTGITYRQALLGNGLVSAVMESSRAFAADGGVDSVVLVIPGEGNFYAVQDLPLEVHLWYDKAQNVYGTVRETIAPVIGRPASIAEINTITCA